ncbi:MAG: (d)CMP kinase [Anaerorhabdus sp.]
MSLNIAIDGPTAAGKGTIAKELALRLNYKYLDTGVMYRCVAYNALKNNVKLNDEVKIASLIKKMDLRIEKSNIILNGVDVTSAIRDLEISSAASEVAKLVSVRNEMVSLQRDIAKDRGIVMDGRDIGTVVLPDADLKIFLTADPKVRAMRRYLEYKKNGVDCELEELVDQINKRDFQDSNREISPLKKAEDAIELDTSNLTIEEVVSDIEKLVLKKELR